MGSLVNKPQNLPIIVGLSMGGWSCSSSIVAPAPRRQLSRVALTVDKQEGVNGPLFARPEIPGLFTCLGVTRLSCAYNGVAGRAYYARDTCGVCAGLWSS